MAVSAIQSHLSPSTLTQLASQPGRLKNLPQSQQVKAAAGQFEAILLRQFLQESVSGLMGGDSGGPSGNVYGYLLTDTLASKLSEGGGLGLASVLEKQLSPHSPVHPGALAPKSSS
ncbi:MAG TPA: rod-binding protein [Candidatus Didemnitutus sp.]|nr:rod-binding protein [Candidatus Didemnitutus sp.]